MTTKVLSQQEFFDLYKDEVQSQNGELTDFSDGSLHDTIAGALSTGLNELSELTITEFKKTFFDTANGIEVTGNIDDLNNLAVDHFGDRFKRPPSVGSTGTVKFDRPNTDAGDATILLGSIVKTEKDANGDEIRFKTDAEIIMIGTTINAETTAVDPTQGSKTNVEPGTIIVVESALTDPSITVTNVAKFAGGDDEQEDAEYRETIRALIESLAGATKAAVSGALLAVPGISFVSLIETILSVIEFDIGANDIKAGAIFFRIPFPEAFIADENGASSPGLIALADTALELVRSCGVKIVVQGAVAVVVAWDASITLNAGGPNFSELSVDPQPIIDSMTDFINKEIEIGNGFDVSQANAFILAIWGSAGTDDLTAFTTNVPSGNIAGVTGTKLIAGAITIT